MQIGAQLYTVRAFTQNEKDLGRTLERIAAMGYENVQLSAVGPIAPQRIRALCDANGLRIVLTHNSDQKFLTAVDDLIEEHQIYGCRYIGLGGMNEKYRAADWLAHFAQDFEGPARKIRDAGMLFMYHNHAFEFARLPDGRTLMDALLSDMPEELMGVTADTYWLQFAGVDVNDWIRKHASRLPCVHLKDLAPFGFEARMAAVGQGNINFPAILDTLSQNGVTEYALVEQDNCYGESAFGCLEKSRRCLRELGY